LNTPKIYLQKNSFYRNVSSILKNFAKTSQEIRKKFATVFFVFILFVDTINLKIKNRQNGGFMVRKILSNVLIFSFLVVNCLAGTVGNSQNKISIPSRISELRGNVDLVEQLEKLEENQYLRDFLSRFFNIDEKLVLPLKNILIFFKNKDMAIAKIEDRVDKLLVNLGFTDDFSEGVVIKKGLKTVVKENLLTLSEAELKEFSQALDSNDALFIYQTMIKLFGEKILDAHMKIRGGRVKTIKDIINQDLVFGTSGWRDQIGLGFNPFLIAIIFDSLGEYYKDYYSQHPDEYFLLGFDTREFGPEAVEIATRILDSKGIKVVVPKKVLVGEIDMHVTTPQMAFMIYSHKIVIDGIEYKIGRGSYITASHNPKEDNGIKGFSPEGNAAPSDMTKIIDKLNANFIQKIMKKNGFGQFRQNREISVISYADFDIYKPYLDFLIDGIKKAEVRELILSGKAFFDVSKGSSREVVRAFLRSLGVGKGTEDNFILNTEPVIPVGYHPNPDKQHAGSAILKSAGLVIKTQENDLDIDLSDLSKEQLATLMEQGGEITVTGHKVRMAEEGTKNIKVLAIEKIEQLIDRKYVELIIDGQKRFVSMKRKKDIIVIKMDADDDRVAGQIGGKYLDSNSIGALLTDYHIGNIHSSLKKMKDSNVVSGLTRDLFLEQYKRFIKDGVLRIKIGRTVASTELIDAIVNDWRQKFNEDFDKQFLAKLGLKEITFEVDEVAVGFKNFASKDKEYLVFFESSAHIADWINGVESKDDGMAIGLRLLEIQALNPSKPLVDIVKDIEARVRYKNKFVEIAVDYGGSPKYEETRKILSDKQQLNFMLENFKFLLKKEGINLAVKKVVMIDGLKIIFEDNSSLLIRVSGTERKGRIYIQAEDAKLELFRGLGNYLLGQDTRYDASMMFPYLSKFFGLNVKFFDQFNAIIKNITKYDKNFENFKNISTVLKAV
jgi:phosphomannomutase